MSKAVVGKMITSLSFHELFLDPWSSCVQKLDISCLFWKTSESRPLPIPEDTDASAGDDRRLWIGNLDLRVTEFSLLKILQKYGNLERFDFLYHKAGPDIGKPRGYCFASFENRKEAEKALRSLNGKLALTKRLVVRWAHKEEDQGLFKSKEQMKKLESPQETISPHSKIRAIESKLKSMEHAQNEFTISTKPTAPPGTSRYSVVNAPETNSQKHSSKPYYRKDHRR